MSSATSGFNRLRLSTKEPIEDKSLYTKVNSVTLGLTQSNPEQWDDSSTRSSWLTTSPGPLTLTKVSTGGNILIAPMNKSSVMEESGEEEDKEDDEGEDEELGEDMTNLSERIGNASPK